MTPESTRKPMHDLRPYQIEAIASIEREWENDKRSTLLVLATGLGKTTCFSEIARRMRDNGGRTLVLAHRTELVTQAAKRLEATTLTTQIESGSQRASWLQWPIADTVVATVQTLKGRRLAKWPRDHFARVVVDEAHRATAPAYRAIFDHFADAKILGVTATPDRGDGVALGGVFESVAYQYGINEGIRAGYLCDLRSVVVDLDGVSLDGVKTKRQEHGIDLAPDELARVFETESACHGIAGPLAKLAGDRKTLLFMPSVKAAHEVARVLSAYVGADKVRSLDGGSEKDQRAEYLREFEHGAVQFLVNCALFTEGFDAPIVSCVAVARPTKSRALYAQMVGRGTRLFPGKTDCLIVDFAPRNTKHDLAKVTDIFDGEDMDAETQAQVQRELASGESVMAAREKAKAAALEREASRARAREQARIIADARFTAQKRDVWTMDGSLGVSAEQYRPSIPLAREDQLAKLRAFKIEPAAGETVQSASMKIAALAKRRRDGLCTIKQASVFARAGLNPDMSFEDARGAMDMLIANKWRATPEMLRRWPPCPKGATVASMEADLDALLARARMARAG